MELDAIGDALQLDVRPFPFQFPVHGELIDERLCITGAAGVTGGTEHESRNRCS